MVVARPSETADFTVTPVAVELGVGGGGAAMAE